MSIDNSKRFASTFYLVHESGDHLYPVRMLDRDTGRIAFRVSKGGAGGNTKDVSREIDDEKQLLQLVSSGSYAVRAKTINGNRTGLYKLGQKKVRELVSVSAKS